MIIKVCGIKTEENIDFLSKENIDMVGLNFYKPSVRYIDDDIDHSFFDSLPQHIKKVGVFVNETMPIILEKCLKYELDLVQLHGDEDPAFCNEIASHIPVIKVFRIDAEFDFESTKLYDATYFLFDTQTKSFGGSGKKFDWSMLNSYDHSVPFLLSGGIGPHDVESIQNIDHPKFYGIDINSKFESEPGIKDKNLVLPFIKVLKVK